MIEPKGVGPAGEPRLIASKLVGLRYETVQKLDFC